MADGPSFGAFELVRPLARGGMAEVWAAVHRSSGMAVSVKVITGEKARDPDFRKAFHHEVRAVARLDHPGVVMVLDHGEVGPDGAGVLPPGSPYLVMEHAGAGTLRDAHRRALVWPEIRTILSNLLSALAYVHAHGVVHRDLKPGNVLVCAAADPRPGLKLSDFGLARLYDEDDRPDLVEAVRGTLHYMAPEQCRGLWRDHGPWTDLYALGCMAYEMGTGRPPYGGLRGTGLMAAHIEAPIPPLPPRRGLPEGFGAWVSRLLQKSPWDRYVFAADALAALQRLPEPEDVGPTRWIFPVLAATQGLPDDLDTDPTPRTPLPDDLPEGAHDEDATVMAQPVASASSPGGRLRERGETPPVPLTWREASAPPPDLRLLDAGQALLSLRAAPFVGRRRERDIAWDLLRQVDAEGRCRALVLRGASGLGISRLASWVASRAHEVGAAHTLLMTHAPVEAPLRPVQRMFLRFLQANGLPREVVVPRIVSFGQRVSLEPIDIDDLVALITGDANSSPLQRYALVRRVLRAIGGDRPVLLRVEDLGYGSDSVGLLHHLMETASDADHLLVVATVRDEPDAIARVAPVERHPRTRSLELGPLSPGDMRTLVHQRLRLASPLSLQVEEMAKGNPMFAAQLVSDWADRGLLVPGQDGFDLRPGEPVQFPASAHAAWDARIQRVLAHLPPEAGPLLERAAVLGEPVDRALWALASRDLDPDGRVGARLLDALEGAHLVRIRGGAFAFAHPMAREGALSRARELGRLAAHHAQAALALEGAEDTSLEVSERLGRHRLAAGDVAAAIAPLLRAAEGWRRAGSHRECLHLLALIEPAFQQVGIPPTDPRQVHALQMRIDCHQRRGELAAARAGVERARQVAQDPSLPPLLRAELDILDVRLSLWVDDIPAAEAALERVHRHVDDPPAALAIQVAQAEGQIARERRDLVTAEARFREAAHLAEALGDAAALGGAWRDLGVLAWVQRDLDAATAAYERAREVLRRAGLPKEMATALNNLGEVYRARGDLDAAEQTYEQAAALFERAGVSAAAPYPYLNLALVRIISGRHHAALEPLERALDEVSRQGNARFERLVRTLLAPCCVALGDWPGLTRQLDRIEALSGLNPPGELDLARAVRAAGDTAVQARRVHEARRLYALGAELYQALGDEDRATACRRLRDVLDES